MEENKEKDETKDKETIKNGNEEVKNEEVKKEKKEKENKYDKKYKEKIEKLEKENNDLKDRLLREIAELDNFKKRTNLERINERKYASINLVSELINHLDNLRQVVNMTTEDEVLKNFLIGFKMINDQIFEVLKNDGLEMIDGLNKKFDPAYQQAIEVVENNELDDNIVVEILKPGYIYKDRVIKPALVKVNKKKEC